MFIGACVKEVPKARQYTNKNSKRHFSRMYNIRSIPVCREQFIETFRISTKRVNTALSKLRSDDLNDRRGKVQGGRNKIDEKRVDEIKTQINRIPRYVSHYKRAENNCEFLPPEMTLQKMFDLYVVEKIEKTEDEGVKNQWENGSEEEKKTILKNIDAVSFSTYRRTFLNNFNLKFKTLKSDTCNTCDNFSARLKSARPEDKNEIQDAHNTHIDLWKEAMDKMKKDGEEAKRNNEVECLTFDLEKTLPLPRIPTNIIFYKRQLWVYNAGIHSLKNDCGYCYVWTEAEAGRGAQEIGSCLIKHLETQVGNDIKHLVLWSDSCGGQNRNIKIVLILKSCLESHPSLETIKLKYLVPGHSFLPNDSDFSDIESALKHVQRIYHPDDFIQVMRNCRRKKPFCVTRMKPSDFKGTSELEKRIVNRKQTNDNIPIKINWLKIREICIKKEEPLKLFCRSDFTSDYLEIDLEKRAKKGRPIGNFSFKQLLQPLWLSGKEISAPKLKDIKSILHLIPNDVKSFYQSLSGSRAVEDDVDGFSAPLDFEIDEEI